MREEPDSCKQAVVSLLGEIERDIPEVSFSVLELMEPAEEETPAEEPNQE